jgi:hypothetical protein
MTIDLSGKSANIHSNNNTLITLSFPTIITTTGARTPGLRASQAKLTELQVTTVKHRSKSDNSERHPALEESLPLNKRSIHSSHRKEKRTAATTHPKDGEETSSSFGSTTCGPSKSTSSQILAIDTVSEDRQSLSLSSVPPLKARHLLASTKACLWTIRIDAQRTNCIDDVLVFLVIDTVSVSR